MILFGTLKVQSFMLTEVRDCDLLIVITSSTFLKRKDMLKEHTHTHHPNTRKNREIYKTKPLSLPRQNIASHASNKRKP